MGTVCFSRVSISQPTARLLYITITAIPELPISVSGLDFEAHCVMRQVRFLILLLASVTCVVAGNDDNNHFINPPDNNGMKPVYTLGDKVVVSWKTTLDVFNVSIWQQNLAGTGASSQGNIYCWFHSLPRLQREVINAF